MLISSLYWNCLSHIPQFDDKVVFEAEHVNYGAFDVLLLLLDMGVHCDDTLTKQKEGQPPPYANALLRATHAPYGNRPASCRRFF